ncbi:hypothetical protein ABPG72_017662 [Tetrahymena utriculariae]
MQPEKPQAYTLFKENWTSDFPLVKCEYLFSEKLKKQQESIFCNYCIQYYKHFEEDQVIGSKGMDKTRLSENLTLKSEFHFNSEKFQFGHTEKSQNIQKYHLRFEKLFKDKKTKLEVTTKIIRYRSKSRYDSRKFCGQFLDCIYQVLFEDLMAQIKHNQYISISKTQLKQNIKRKRYWLLLFKFTNKWFSWRINIQNSIPYYNLMYCPQKQSSSKRTNQRIPIYQRSELFFIFTGLLFKQKKDIRLDLLSENQTNLLYGDDHECLITIQLLDVRWISNCPSFERLIKLLLPILET